MDPCNEKVDVNPSFSFLLTPCRWPPSKIWEFVGKREVLTTRELGM